MSDPLKCRRKLLCLLTPGSVDDKKRTETGRGHESDDSDRPKRAPAKSKGKPNGKASGKANGKASGRR